MISKKDINPTGRFSHAVENYSKYRPGYPAEVVDILKKKCDLHSQSRITDVGSGTGIFTKLLLDHGYVVTAVEPNLKMHQAAAHYLNGCVRFTGVNAPAEQTTLADHSIDLITTAQAFHWFDLPKVKKEFLRILKPSGHLVLLWNLRANKPGIMQAYDALLQKFGTDYKEVCANNNITDDVVRDFYSPHSVEIIFLPNQQLLDWEQLKGRLLSTSYAPKPGDFQYDEAIIALKNIFDAYQRQGKISFDYETKLYIGSLIGG